MIARNTVPFHATPFHVCEVGRVRDAHVIPSAELAACVPPLATVTNSARLALHAIADHAADAGRVRAVQVMPSAEVAAAVPPEAIAQNTVPLHVTADQFEDVGRVREVQVIPSGEEAACVPPEAMATKRFVPFHATPVQFAVAGNIPCEIGVIVGVRKEPSVGASKYGPSVKTAGARENVPKALAVGSVVTARF